MILSQNTIDNLQKAHVVNGIQPDQYLVKYRNIFELVEYRAHLQPDEIFITYYSDDFPKTSLTYSEFKDKVFRTANLMKSLGVTMGSRISTISYNHINTVIQYFAAWAIGATVVPVNVSEEPDRIKYILQSSGTKLAFVKREYYEKIEKIAHELEIDFIIHGNGELQPAAGIMIFEDEIKKQSAELEPDDSVNQETEALIVYTSGTTGLPKGVVLTQYNLMADADGISKWHGISKGNIIMCVLPIHHVNGTVVTIMTPMYAGAGLVLNQKFHTDTFFHRLRDENVNIVSVVPTLLQFLCHEYEANKEFVRHLSPLLLGELPGQSKGQGVRLENFRHIICGAGPLTCELVDKFERIFLSLIHI